MKKAVSIILAAILLTLTITATVNAEIVNQSALKFTDEVIAEAEAASGTSIPTSRVYFKMPAQDYWYSDYSVYQGQYYAGIYWWGSDVLNPEAYPGYRASIDDYDQGIYYAEIPDGVALAIWDNGFAATQAERETEKYRQMRHSTDLYVECAFEGDFDTLPEGSPNLENMDGCIFVYDPDSVIGQGYYDHPEFNYCFQPYIYYGNGCYGSYAETSENFVSIEENCLNPDHFDEQGNHIGGDHIKAPVSPENPPVDTEPDSAINGWYFVSDREPNTIRSENKLYRSTVEGEYYRYRYISQSTRFKIVHYMDGMAVSDCEQFPAQGWYNENGEFNNYPTGTDYTVWFRPDGSGDSSFIDGTIKVVPDEQMPTEWSWEKPTENLEPHPAEAETQPPTSTDFDTPTEPMTIKERFEAYCENAYSGVTVISFKELYSHQDQTGETDWVLVYAVTNMQSPMALNTLIGNRVIMGRSCGVPFDAGYGVYDVSKDSFVNASTSAAKSYDGFERTFDRIGSGRLLGDVDKDGDISIIDTTIIQRCEAKIYDYPADDEIRPLDGLWMYSVRYYSDFDRDGERSILDATKLQRYLVNV